MPSAPRSTRAISIGSLRSSSTRPSSRSQVPRVEPRLHRGEWLLIHWYAHSDGEAVRAITRFEADGDRLTRVRNYFYTPDVLAEICAELQIPFRSNGHRYWKPLREEA
jgi:RNA polymerase sigma-70 factor (ECF subfamily)